ncbi:hypothetical protein NDU88_004619 [Pleurodeles waltl]|uniref:Uncharacterized protein n=1 Tax=Pleurodeles waltl TaxID=8319 RepID=A0AAV7RK40_PLEWA|nr:hypothetical protein NDU88_004619 [Pleurodeles waltl]
MLAALHSAQTFTGTVRRFCTHAAVGPAKQRRAKRQTSSKQQNSKSDGIRRYSLVMVSKRRVTRRRQPSSRVSPGPGGDPLASVLWTSRRNSEGRAVRRGLPGAVRLSLCLRALRALSPAYVVPAPWAERSICCWRCLSNRAASVFPRGPEQALFFVSPALEGRVAPVQTVIQLPLRRRGLYRPAHGAPTAPRLPDSVSPPRRGGRLLRRAGLMRPPQVRRSAGRAHPPQARSLPPVSGDSRGSRLQGSNSCWSEPARDPCNPFQRWRQHFPEEP